MKVIHLNRKYFDLYHALAVALRTDAVIDVIRASVARQNSAFGLAKFAIDETKHDLSPYERARIAWLP